MAPMLDIDHSGASQRRVTRVLLALVCAAVLPVTGTVAGCDISWHAHATDFPNSIPGTHTDVSYQDAFRHHNIQVPTGISGLEYDALSNVDGYPLDADFLIPCAETAGFVQSNNLTEVANYYNLPSAEIYMFAKRQGWVDTGAHNYWYQQPAGPAAKVEVLIAEASSCRVYLSAAD